MKTGNETSSVNGAVNKMSEKGPSVHKRSQQRRWKQPHDKNGSHSRGSQRHNNRQAAVRGRQMDRGREDRKRLQELEQGACYPVDTAPIMLAARQQQSGGERDARYSDTKGAVTNGNNNNNCAPDSARFKDYRDQASGEDFRKNSKYKLENSQHVLEDKRKASRRGKQFPSSSRGQYRGRGISRGYPTFGSWQVNHGQQDSFSHNKTSKNCLDFSQEDQLGDLTQANYSRELVNSDNKDTERRSNRTKPRGFDRQKRGYGSQKNDVIRALSHLNPVQSSQASSLCEQLRNETYECMVCCERVRCTAAVWSCDSCFHVFHLGCVRKWARCPAATANLEGENGGWRCPGCQNISQGIPSIYNCFCGKVLDPVWRPSEGLTPHTCGELCGKRRADASCPHRCNQLCHPGPCPSCPVMITKQCACGKTSSRVRCGQAMTVLCQQVCNKVLNCFTHRCTRICHTGPCEDCQIEVQQSCYCGKQQRDTLCGTGEAGFVNRDGKSGYFSCQSKCSKKLDCGNHYCQRICHPGDCDECLLKPTLVTFCPCGKTPISELLNEARMSCLDPVPTCGSTCDKVLPCSPQRELGNHLLTEEEHRCKKECHFGECGPCDGITKVKCRCGARVKEIPCIQKGREEYRCERRCNKKKSCGKHKCGQRCCVNTEHRCELLCRKKLSCGLHECSEPCHLGYCPPCLMSGFDELSCHCGATKMLPPIPCGTRPPECDKPCSRTHACSHPVNHPCHSEEKCPPCPYLTTKRCMGDHEFRHNIPCHVKFISCGMVCGKLLTCGHKCQKICHKPPCLGPGDSCVQPCDQLRNVCGHKCAVPCHFGSGCPAVPCEAKVTVHCKCGNRSEVFPCLQGGDQMAVTKAFQRIATETLANKMKDLQSGQCVDVSRIVKADDKHPRQLDCNDDCAIYERNKRLAEALDIENPDLSQHGGKIRYSPFLVAEAKQRLDFLKSVEDAFENLVQTTLKLSVSQRSHSFSSMNSNQRRLIHELAVFYNCSSQSYDREPKRNTVITATKGSHLPNVKLSTQIEREIKPPAPRLIPFLPSRVDQQPKPFSNQAPRKTQAWTQLPDYFSDDFGD